MDSRWPQSTRVAACGRKGAVWGNPSDLHLSPPDLGSHSPVLQAQFRCSKNGFNRQRFVFSKSSTLGYIFVLTVRRYFKEKKKKKKVPAHLWWKKCKLKIHRNTVLHPAWREKLNTCPHTLGKESISCDPAPPPHCTSQSTWVSLGTLLMCRFWLQCFSSLMCRRVT